MPKVPSTMKMPELELLVFARVFVVGLSAAEVFRVTYYGGEKFAPLLADVEWPIRAAGIVAVVLVCLAYAYKRAVFSTVLRLGRSLRFDLLFIALIGVWTNQLISPWLVKFHTAVSGVDPLWAPTLLGILLLVLVSPLWMTYWPQKKMPASQFSFFTDEEITTKGEDILKNHGQAEIFAETVLASGAHSGLVFGIDGPWGVGKTSFINLAEEHWRDTGADSVIVFRFEPLRYAADPDLSERFIRDLSASIQRQVFAPEFRSAASRYTRMLKGKVDFSLLGFKLSLEPSSETIDELLEDVDGVLKRIRRRVIVVVDDLDRLEAKAVNNVLFTVRRTFNLSQATYILCYDTENLVHGADEGGKAREFLEKFVNVKFSLFVDSLTLQNFLRTDWKRDESRYPSIPSDTMAKLSHVLIELADILDGNKASKYVPLIGDLRKIKRFINAVLLIEIEKTDLGRTDFNNRDLINLMLLYLNYPGLFRRIYAEETENRSGVFSAKRSVDSQRVLFSNDDEFNNLLIEYDNEVSARFLLEQLFDLKVLGVEKFDPENKYILSSRACFNSEPYRNLDKYLNLIVRRTMPEPRDTFRLYQDAVDRVVSGSASISSVLVEHDFHLQNGELAHDKFWRVLISRSIDFKRAIAEDAINTLVSYLPSYSYIGINDRGLRERSIYSLLRLLNNVGWGRTNDRLRYENTPENVIEISRRIYGEDAYQGQGLIYRLTHDERGVLGWYDLILLRLQCSADRQGQIFNLHTALIVHDDMNAPTSGSINLLALNGMRTLSQRVFKLFRKKFIGPRRNYLVEVNETPDNDFYGAVGDWLKMQREGKWLKDKLLAERSSVKSFVIYQLANRGEPNGSGVGCGFYDEDGTGDKGGISAVMNDYVFDVCFNPLERKSNIYEFADYCLCNLQPDFWTGKYSGLVATEIGLVGGLDRECIKKYWVEFGDMIKCENLNSINKQVFTENYVATYSEDLPKVFAVLDSLLIN